MPPDIHPNLIGIFGGILTSLDLFGTFLAIFVTKTVALILVNYLFILEP